MPPVIAAVGVIVGAIGAAVATVATVGSAIIVNAATALSLVAGGSAAAQALGVASFGLLSTGVEVGALMGVSALLKPHLDVGGGGMQTAFKADPQAGVPFVVGRTGTAGNIVFADVAGSKNQDLSYVVVLSAGGPIQSIESFSVGGAAVAFDGTGACTSAPYDVSAMWQKTQLGAAGSSALTIAGPSIPSEWGSAEKLSGKAAAIWTLRYAQNVYAAGTPAPLWVLKGGKFYDPRLDSTYPGGSGAQRSGTPSTWTYSENPFLAGLAWSMGVYENGKRIMGLGAPLAGIDVAAFVAGANVADTNGWKVGGVVYSTDDKYDVLTAMLQAGGGSVLKLGARISCFVNTPRVSLATLTARDVVGDVSVTASQSRRTRINKIWPRYREESAGWELTPTAAPVVVSAYVTADGEERSRQVDYQLVQDATQVAQLARYDIENAREFGPIVLPCKPRWVGYKPGDCITVTEPEYGLNGQLVLIVDRQVDPATMMVTLTCRSETTGKHAFALGQTGTPPPTPGITGVDPNLVGTPGAATWTMTGSSFVGAGQLPGLIIDGAIDDPNVDGIIVDYRQRLTTTPTWGPWASAGFPATATRLVVTGVKDGAFYGAQVRYKTVRGVEDFSAGLDLGVVEVGAIEISDQGLLATLDTVEDEQLAAGVGVNCLVDTQFSQGSNWWRPDGDSSVTGSYPVSANNVVWAKVVNTGGAVGQQIRFGSDNQVNSLPIKPGDNVEVSSVVGSHGCSSVAIYARWLDATGHNIGGVPQSTLLQSISAAGAGGGEIDSGTRIGGFAQAPAGAYRVMFVVVGIIAAGGSGNDWIFVTQPMLAKAKDGSAVLSQFNQGFLGQPGADVTSGEIAAGFAGQQNGATTKFSAQSTAPSSPASGDIWIDTSGSPFQIKRWSGSAWTVIGTVGAVTGSNLVSTTYGTLSDADIKTILGVASAVTGQQNGATTKFSSQTSAPTSPATGDWWVDTSSTTQFLIKRWSGSAWVLTATVGALTGSNLISATYGSLSDADVKTVLGIASAVTGQQNGATTKFSLQSTAPSSPATGDQWVDSSSSPYLIKRWNGSSWDVIGTVGSVTGVNLQSAVYGTLTDADIKTILGVASGFTGQQNGATTKFSAQSSAPTSPATGDWWVDTSASPFQIKRWSGSAWVVTATVGAQTGITLVSATYGTLRDADIKTILGISAGFTGQGPFATYQAPVESVTAPQPNLLNNGDFRLMDTGWTLGPWTIHDDAFGRYIASSTTSSPLGTSPTFPATPGQPVTASFNCEVDSGTVLDAQIGWFKSDGSANGFSSVLSLTGTISAWTRYALSATPPANTAKALVWFWKASGPGGVYVSSVKAEQGSIATAPAASSVTQGALYSDNVHIDSLKPGELGANVTGSHVAAAVSGQQNGATTKFSRQSSAPSSPNSGDQWVDTSATPNLIKQWDASSSVWAIIGTVGGTLGSNIYSTTHGLQGDSDLITNQGVASGFTGQQNGATTKFSAQSSAPSSPSTGDRWVDTSGAIPVEKRWNGSSWAVIGGGAPAALTVSVSGAPAAWTGLSGGGTQTTNSVSVSVSGGSGSYTYGWAIAHGDSVAAISSATSSSVTWSRQVGSGDAWHSVWRCWVQDSSTGVLGYVDVAVTFTDTH